MKFHSVEQAIKFSFNVSEREEFSRTDLLGTRGTSQDDLSPMDLHAQAAMIHSMLNRLHQVERDSILSMYGRGRARSDAIRGFANYLHYFVRGTVPSVRELQIILLHWSTKRPSIRKIAEERGVSYRQVCNWRNAVLRAWMPVQIRAIDKLHGQMFTEGGFELSV
jgi:hypothetical protein